MTENIQVNVRQPVPLERLRDLLTSAFEGGSNYWYYDLQIISLPPGAKKADFKFWHIEIPALAGGVLGLRADDNEEKCLYRLDLPALLTGIQLMADRYPRHFADVINEDDDADTGDVFLQLCLFEAIVFG